MLLHIDYLKDVSGDLKLLGNGKMGWAIFSVYSIHSDHRNGCFGKKIEKNMVSDV